MDRFLCWIGWHRNTRPLRDGERECLRCQRFIFARNTSWSWHDGR